MAFYAYRELSLVYKDPLKSAIKIYQLRPILRSVKCFVLETYIFMSAAPKAPAATAPISRKLTLSASPVNVTTLPSPVLPLPPPVKMAKKPMVPFPNPTGYGALIVLPAEVE